MTKPTDAEIDALILDVIPASKHYLPVVIEKTRAAILAALAKWGQPQAVAGGEPVAEFDEWQGRPVLLAGAPVLKHKQPLYTAPPPQAVREPLTPEQKKARNPYRHSRGAASIWLAGFDAAELWHRITKGGQ